MLLEKLLGVDEIAEGGGSWSAVSASPAMEAGRVSFTQRLGDDAEDHGQLIYDELRPP